MFVSVQNLLRPDSKLHKCTCNCCPAHRFFTSSPDIQKRTKVNKISCLASLASWVDHRCSTDLTLYSTASHLIVPSVQMVHKNLDKLQFFRTSSGILKNKSSPNIFSQMKIKSVSKGMEAQPRQRHMATRGNML
jgi:hypothetical protein